MATTSSPAPQTDPAPPARRRYRALKWFAAILVLLLLLLIGSGVAALRTEWGARMLWQAALRFAPGQLSGELGGGTLGDGITLRNVIYQDDTQLLKIDRLTGSWHVALSPPKLTVRFLRIGTVDITQQPSPPEPAKPPGDILLPLAIDVQKLTIDEVLIRKEGETARYSDIDLAGSSDRVRHALGLKKAVTPFGTVRADLRMNGAAPHDLDGTATLAGTYREQDYKANARLSGTLEAPGIRLDVTGKGLDGKASIDATPFGDVPFRRAEISIAGFDPQGFNAEWPKAELDVHALLAPDSAANPSQLVVAGPVRITNGRPGTIDKGRLPLVSVQADARLDAERQQLSGVRIRLPGAGVLEGGGELRSGGEGNFSLRAKELDLQALHGALRKTRLDGPLAARLEGDTQHLTLELADKTFSAAADATLAPERITLKTARLGVGAARLDLKGTLGRGAESDFTASGALREFNPSLFLAAIQPPDAKAGKEAKKGKNAPPPKIDANINMDFEAQGALAPELSAKIRFDVKESRYANLPMTGGGQVQLAGKRVLPSDAKLSIAGNLVSLKGSFGAPSDRLRFDIDAPALDRLGFGVSGLLKANGELGGTTARPTIDADYRAEKLAFGAHRLTSLSGDARIQGVPGSTPDAKMALHIRARGVQSGDVRFDAVDADIDGTYASHTIRIGADGRLRGERLDLSLAARGNLQENPEGMAWDGVVSTLENRGLPRVAMTAPVQVGVAPGRLSLGATRLTIEGALVDLKSLRYAEDRIQSEGKFSALNVGHLLALQRQFTGQEPPVNTNLVLDGGWNVTLADRAAGFVQIERRSGDIRLPTRPGETALGLNALSLRADLKGDRVAFSGKANAARIGSIDGQGQLMLQTGGTMVTVAPDAALSARVNASVPRLQSIASLAGPQIALDGSLGADIRVAGTLDKPDLSGTVAGDRLALTLYDQGIRLADGIARLSISNNIVELRQLEFRGGDGTLRATGRIPLDSTNTGLTAAIVADKLQLLASPSGRLTLSGRATASNANGQLLVAGRFVADRALFSLPETSPPKLGDDVVVVRGQKAENPPAAVPAAEQPAGPFSPRINVEFDLGERFRFEGSGAELRLAGAVRLESEPGATPQAFGTVRVAEGTYKAFGTDLLIERGVLNFQGVPANPNINILAMRREQEVAAGVQVTGTVQQPRVQLVSEPAVSEEEKLSWLIFGRAGGSTEQGQAQSAARGAALGLLNKFGSERIAKSFGLDQFSLGKSEYGLENQQVVNLGKELTERLTIGYEQSLAGAESVLKLTYELSRSWTVVVRGGTITGLNLFFNRRFDSVGGS